MQGTINVKVKIAYRKNLWANFKAGLQSQTIRLSHQNQVNDGVKVDNLI